MALIKIKADGTFESLSATSDAKINRLNAIPLAQLKKDARLASADLKVAYKISALDEKISKLNAQLLTAERAHKAAKTVALKASTKATIEKHKAAARAHRVEIKSLKQQLHDPKNRNLARIRNHAASLDSAVTRRSKTKSSTKAPATPAVKKTAPKETTATKKTLAARGIKVTIAPKKAGTKVVKDVKSGLKKSAPEKKPAAALNKKENVKSPAIVNVLAKIKAIKADIAVTKTATKRQHLEKDLAALRSQLRVLRKGQSTKNKAAVTKAKPSGNMGSSKSKVAAKSGMGSAKTTKKTK